MQKLYPVILEELKRRGIMRNGDTVIFDKGYYSYKNYLIGVSRFKIVPLIFIPKERFQDKQGFRWIELSSESFS